MNPTKPALGAAKPANKHHIKSFGHGLPACRAAHEHLNNLYNDTLKKMKRRPVSELFLTGTCGKWDEAVSWSITAYSDDLDEVAFMRGEI